MNQTVISEGMKSENRIAIKRNFKVLELRMMSKDQKDLMLINLYDRFITTKEDYEKLQRECQTLKQEQVNRIQ